MGAKASGYGLFIKIGRRGVKWLNYSGPHADSVHKREFGLTEEETPHAQAAQHPGFASDATAFSIRCTLVVGRRSTVGTGEAFGPAADSPGEA